MPKQKTKTEQGEGTQLANFRIPAEWITEIDKRVEMGHYASRSELYRLAVYMFLDGEGESIYKLGITKEMLDEIDIKVAKKEYGSRFDFLYQAVHNQHFRHERKKVDVPEKLNDYLDGLIKTGMYQSREEIVAELIRKKMDEEKRDPLQKIYEGFTMELVIKPKKE